MCAGRIHLNGVNTPKFDPAFLLNPAGPLTLPNITLTFELDPDCVKMNHDREPEIDIKGHSVQK